MMQNITENPDWSTNLRRTSTKNIGNLDTAQGNTEANRTLIYTEDCNGKSVFHKLNFDSPRTKKAAKILGITFENCCLK